MSSGIFPVGFRVGQVYSDSVILCNLFIDLVEVFMEKVRRGIERIFSVTARELIVGDFRGVRSRHIANESNSDRGP